MHGFHLGGKEPQYCNAVEIQDLWWSISFTEEPAYFGFPEFSTIETHVVSLEHTHADGNGNGNIWDAL